MQTVQVITACGSQLGHMTVTMQVGNWVANSILQYEELEERVEAVQQFILIAKVTLTVCTHASCVIHTTYEDYLLPQIELKHHDW